MDSLKEIKHLDTNTDIFKPMDGMGISIPHFIPMPTTYKWDGNIHSMFHHYMQMTHGQDENIHSTFHPCADAYGRPMGGHSGGRERDVGSLMEQEVAVEPWRAYRHLAAMRFETTEILTIL